MTFITLSGGATMMTLFKTAEWPESESFITNMAAKQNATDFAHKYPPAVKVVDEGFMVNSVEEGIKLHQISWPRTIFYWENGTLVIPACSFRMTRQLSPSQIKMKSMLRHWAWRMVIWHSQLKSLSEFHIPQCWSCDHVNTIAWIQWCIRECICSSCVLAPDWQQGSCAHILSGFQDQSCSNKVPHHSKTGALWCSSPHQVGGACQTSIENSHWERLFGRIAPLFLAGWTAIHATSRLMLVIRFRSYLIVCLLAVGGILQVSTIQPIVPPADCASRSFFPQELLSHDVR